MNDIIIWYYLIINAVSFMVMVWDKGSAINSTARVPEKKLWLLAITGGPLGMFMAGKLVRHKTLKLSFSLGLPALILLHLVVLRWMFM
ncbi:MAG: DUF1294 domain-containing protein [Bacillota bacterium]|nr:DUF1294 domain-containing protein [Bacillota bacterium]